MFESVPAPPCPSSIPPEDWERTPRSVQEAFVQLVARVEKLKAIVRDLLDRLGTNSSNSSKPPSSDPPWAKPGRRKNHPSGRRRGGQPGHPPHQRQVLPPEAVTETYDYRPTVCSHCDRLFVDGEDMDLEPVLHQTVDIPEVRPRVVEHRRRVLRCRACNKNTVAALGSSASVTH